MSISGYWSRRTSGLSLALTLAPMRRRWSEGWSLFLGLGLWSWTLVYWRNND
jgi:hypothetical protein